MQNDLVGKLYNTVSLKVADQVMGCRFAQIGAGIVYGGKIWLNDQ